MKKFYFLLIIFSLFLLTAEIVQFFLRKTTATIGFMGDIMIGRLVNDTIQKKGLLYPWGSMLHFLKKNDANIGNLETTLTTHDIPVLKVFNFKSHPTHVYALKKANVQVINLANNHSMDFGTIGLIETIEALNKANIGHVGAGKNIYTAQKPFILKRNGIRFGIIGFTDNEPTWQAGPDKPGTNYVTVGDIETVKNLIHPLRKRVDFVIITYHWGPNMRQRPTQEFIDFAHQIIDAGADVIHGHSAHLFQGIEVYQNRLILYDTGDFIDDYIIHEKERNDLSFLFNIIFSKHTIESLRLIPIKISKMQVNQASEEQARWALDKMIMLSTELGTTLEKDGSWNRSN